MPTVIQDIPNTTFVSSALPDINFSYSPVLYTGTDPNFQNCISFMEIALPSLPVTMVQSALLQLAVIGKSGADPSPVVVNQVMAPLNTAAVTYNTRPNYTPTSSHANVTASDIYTTIQIDITALVNLWLSGIATNYGVALTNQDGTTLVQFCSDSILYEPFFPKLILTYSSTPVEPETAICFSYAQLAHVIEQLIALYSANVLTVFTKGLVASSVTGTPYQLYSSPEGTYGGIFILLDGEQQEAIPLHAITAIYTGDGTVYDPSITYLPAPEFPVGCDTNLITALHDYFQTFTDVQMYLGTIVSASGTVYKNEYGMIVLSDANGNTPVFVPVMNITAVLPSTGQGSQKNTPPTVTITDKTGSQV